MYFYYLSNTTFRSHKSKIIFFQQNIKSANRNFAVGKICTNFSTILKSQYYLVKSHLIFNLEHIILNKKIHQFIVVFIKATQYEWNHLWSWCFKKFSENVLDHDDRWCYNQLSMKFNEKCFCRMTSSYENFHLHISFTHVYKLLKSLKMRNAATVYSAFPVGLARASYLSAP